MSATSFIYPSVVFLIAAIATTVIGINAYAATYNVTVDQNIAVNNMGKTASQTIIEHNINVARINTRAYDRAILWGLSYENSGLYNNRLVWNQAGNSTAGYWQVPVQTYTVTQYYTTTITKTVTGPNGETTVITEVKTVSISECHRIDPKYLGVIIVLFLVILLIKRG